MRSIKLFIGLYAMIYALSSCCTGGSFTLKQTDPLIKIMHTDSVFVDKPETFLLARGENATFQFVLESATDHSGLDIAVTPLGKSRSAGFGTVTSGWIHDVKSTNPTHGADDMILAADDMYPDPILDDYDESINAGGHREIIVDVPVARDVEPGDYKFRLTVSSENESCHKDFSMKVYPVTLPEEQNLKVVNQAPSRGFKYMNGGKEIEEGSDEYYECLKITAIAAAENGQNCWYMPCRPTHVLNASGDGFTLDFTVFDKTLDILTEYGNLKYFCCLQIGGRPSDRNWKAEMLYKLVTVEDGKIVEQNTDCRDPRLEKYLKEYFSQFESHLKEKNLLGKCYQHIADEPDVAGTPSQISYSIVAGMVKKYAPHMKVIDACPEIIENQDVSVVILGDNIATMPPVPEGAERWMYTCCSPQKNFANRFVQLPLLKTRLLHWINYKYNECGYLHWGFNIWYYSDDPMNDITPNCADWPGGDLYLIYPGDHKVYPCIRLKAMRDGIRDYDLLKLVEEKDPAKAMEFCDRVILGPDKYDMDTGHFRELRREMLEYLSE